MKTSKSTKNLLLFVNTYKSLKKVSSNHQQLSSHEEIEDIEDSAAKRSRTSSRPGDDNSISTETPSAHSLHVDLGPAARRIIGNRPHGPRLPVLCRDRAGYIWVPNRIFFFFFLKVFVIFFIRNDWKK